MASDMVFGSSGAIVILFNALGSPANDHDVWAVGSLVMVVLQGPACIVVALATPAVPLLSREVECVMGWPWIIASRHVECSLGTCPVNTIGHTDIDHYLRVTIDAMP